MDGRCPAIHYLVITPGSLPKNSDKGGFFLGHMFLSKSTETDLLKGEAILPVVGFEFAVALTEFRNNLKHDDINIKLMVKVCRISRIIGVIFASSHIRNKT